MYNILLVALCVLCSAAVACMALCVITGVKWDSTIKPTTDKIFDISEYILKILALIIFIGTGLLFVIR